MKETTVSIKTINELLEDIHKSSYVKKYFINKQDGHKGVLDGSDGSQGEYNEYFEFYQHPSLNENVFLRVTFNTDSYGDNESISSIQFVEGKAKTITVYEPIN